MPQPGTLFNGPLMVSDVVDEEDDSILLADAILAPSTCLPMDQWQCLKPEYMKNVFERAMNNPLLLDRDTACSEEKYQQVLKKYVNDIETSRTIVVQKPGRPKGSKNK